MRRTLPRQPLACLSAQLPREGESTQAADDSVPGTRPLRTVACLAKTFCGKN